MDNRAEICDLLYRYAEMMDGGQFEAMAGELFEHAVFVVGPEGTSTLDGHEMVELFSRLTIRYPDGTPRTKHVITNPIVEVDEGGATATCRSYYTVFQQTDSLPLQPVVAGRYHDRFSKIGDRWHFVERDYTLMDLIGDVSQHLRS